MAYKALSQLEEQGSLSHLIFGRLNGLDWFFQAWGKAWVHRHGSESDRIAVRF
jgi:hypothetical protein